MLSGCQFWHSLSELYTSLSFVGDSGHHSWLRHSMQPQEQHYPFLSVCAVFSCVQTMVWLPAFGIFYVRTDVDACDHTWGLHAHRKSLCWKLTLGEKFLAALRTWTCDSVVPVFSVGCFTNWAIHSHRLLAATNCFHFPWKPWSISHNCNRTYVLLRKRWCNSLRINWCDILLATGWQN